MVEKIFSMKEAISRFIENGDAIVMGTALEAAIPFSAGHEIIRQKKADLTLIGPISDMLFDQLIGSGCVRRVVAAWVGNVIMGVGYNLRRAIEDGIPRKVEVEDHTNFSIALALHAGAMGEIIENTGWNLKLSSRIEITEPPAKSELKIIRKNDPFGFWTRGNLAV